MVKHCKTGFPVRRERINHPPPARCRAHGLEQRWLVGVIQCDRKRDAGCSWCTWSSRDFTLPTAWRRLRRLQPGAARRSLQTDRKSQESLERQTEAFQVYPEAICFKKGSHMLRLARQRDLSVTCKVDWDVRSQQISEDISALMEEMVSIHLNWNLYNQLKSFLF